MALLSFVDSTPRAYRLKASNAAPLFQHSPGQSGNSDSMFVPQGRLKIAKLMKRSPDAIRKMAIRLGISLNKNRKAKEK
jgi:hypothetical protein